jgi:hypothetical protein
MLVLDAGYCSIDTITADSPKFEWPTCDLPGSFSLAPWSGR